MRLSSPANENVNAAKMARLASVCVFCGSRAGADPAYRACAERLGVLMAERRIRLVYGGGRVGLMGVLADLVLAHGGAVTGIIPDFLMRLEVGHAEVSELIVVDSMHDRQRRMAELAQGFVVLPGGLGTLAETIEVVNWRKMSLHAKPLAVVNVGGYWDPLAGLVRGFVDNGFAHAGSGELIAFVDGAEAALEALAAALEPAPR